MQRPGPVSNATAAMLLTSASLFDLFVLYVFTGLTEPLWGPLLHFLNVFGILPQYHGIAAFSVFVLLYWVVTELLLGGRSLGRGLLGLQLCDDTGRALPKSRKVKRAVIKLTTLSLTGLNPFRAAGYDRAAKAHWYSPISPPPVRPLAQWQIQFKSGSLRGKQASLGKIPSFAKHGRVRFGREKGWSDVLIGIEEKSVSNRHCVLLVRNGELLLQDGEGQGSGARNGTFLDGGKLTSGATQAIGSAKTFSFGGMSVAIIR